MVDLDSFAEDDDNVLVSHANGGADKLRLLFPDFNPLSNFGDAERFGDLLLGGTIVDEGRGGASSGSNGGGGPSFTNSGRLRSVSGDRGRSSVETDSRMNSGRVRNV